MSVSGGHGGVLLRSGERVWPRGMETDPKWAYACLIRTYPKTEFAHLGWISILSCPTSDRYRSSIGQPRIGIDPQSSNLPSISILSRPALERASMPGWPTYSRDRCEVRQLRTGIGPKRHTSERNLSQVGQLGVGIDPKWAFMRSIALLSLPTSGLYLC